MQQKNKSIMEMMDDLCLREHQTSLNNPDWSVKLNGARVLLNLLAEKGIVLVWFGVTPKESEAWNMKLKAPLYEKLEQGERIGPHSPYIYVLEAERGNTVDFIKLAHDPSPEEVFQAMTRYANEYVRPRTENAMQTAR